MKKIRGRKRQTAASTMHQRMRQRILFGRLLSLFVLVLLSVGIGLVLKHS